jgi:hypothetical protein
MPATCFAAPPILFAEPVLPDDDVTASSKFQVPSSGSAFAITVRQPGHYFFDVVTAAAARIRLAGSGFLPYS